MNNLPTFELTRPALEKCGVPVEMAKYMRMGELLNPNGKDDIFEMLPFDSFVIELPLANTTDAKVVSETLDGFKDASAIQRLRLENYLTTGIIKLKVTRESATKLRVRAKLSAFDEIYCNLTYEKLKGVSIRNQIGDDVNEAYQYFYQVHELCKYLANPTIKTTGTKPSKPSNRPSKTDHRPSKKVITNVRYVLDGTDRDFSYTNRPYTRYAEAWSVRGYWRTYKKTGNRIWIDPFIKGDKEAKVETKYIVK